MRTKRNAGAGKCLDCEWLLISGGKYLHMVRNMWERVSMAFALANLFLQLVEKILNSLADEELLEINAICCRLHFLNLPFVEM